MNRRFDKLLIACIALTSTFPLVAFAQDGAPPPQPAAQDSNAPRVVRVTAEGYNRDDAIKQALRKALEQGAGVQIAAFSTVQNFELARDTIYSRAFGIVKDYRVLEERPGDGGTVIVTVEATVRPSAVAEAWGEVQNVLDQIGRPKIMVWIDETIDNEPQRDSMVESRLAEMFLKAGFDLVDRRALNDITHREGEDARDERNAAKLARLAKDAGAHILIRGAANANRAGLENLYGVPAAFYNCDVQARIYYTDTGKLLASESLPITRTGVRSRKEYSPQAARAAMAQATFPPEGGAQQRREPPLAIKLFESVMSKWSEEITAGGDIELEVENLDFKTFVELKKALAEVDSERIKSVDADFTKGTGKFRIKALMPASTFAERLLEKPFDAWLEIVDLKVNRIQAKKSSKAAP